LNGDGIGRAQAGLDVGLRKKKVARVPHGSDTEERGREGAAYRFGELGRGPFHGWAWQLVLRPALEIFLISRSFFY
jgi:hypothetical protein